MTNTVEETSRFASAADADLIAASRTGDSESFAELFRRHRGAVRAVAMRHVRSASEADDLTSEAFAKVFELIKEGRGPDAFFRAYTCTAVSRLAYAHIDRSHRDVLTDEPDLFEDPSQRYVDPVMAAFESTVVSKAFVSLPERWQAVLWYSEVDGLRPAAIAPFLGLSPNGVSALLLRAREGLRSAYLQNHIVFTEGDQCEPIAPLLGAYVRQGLGERNSARVSRHLESCDRCSGMVRHLSDVGASMRSVVLPLYIGVAASFAPMALLGAAGTTAAAPVAESAAASAPAAAPAPALAPAPGADSGASQPWYRALRSPVGAAAASIAAVAAAAAVIAGVQSQPSPTDVVSASGSSASSVPAPSAGAGQPSASVPSQKAAPTQQASQPSGAADVPQAVRSEQAAAAQPEAPSAALVAPEKMPDAAAAFTRPAQTPGPSSSLQPSASPAPATDGPLLPRLSSSAEPVAPSSSASPVLPGPSSPVPVPTSSAPAPAASAAPTPTKVPTPTAAPSSAAPSTSAVPSPPSPSPTAPSASPVLPAPSSSAVPLPTPSGTPVLPAPSGTPTIPQPQPTGTSSPIPWPSITILVPSSSATPTPGASWTTGEATPAPDSTVIPPVLQEPPLVGAL